VTIAGLGGEPDYEQRFSGWAKDIDKGPQIRAGRQDRHSLRSGGDSRSYPAVFARIGKEAKPQDALVVMLIGHGTFDAPTTRSICRVRT